MRYRHGFTLIELSIVLVIIGLVIGGVIGGKEMIENARVRAQIHQLQSIAVAITTFKGKYNAVPGDMTQRQNEQVGFRVADGPDYTWSGNGIVNDSLGQLYPIWMAGEPLRFAFELGQAGLINEPPLTSSWTSHTNMWEKLIPSVLNPQTRWLPSAYESLDTGETDLGVWLWLAVDVPSVMFQMVSGYSTINAGLLPSQARAVDLKIDDGAPYYGAVRAAQSTAVGPGQGYVDYQTAGECIGDEDGETYATSDSTFRCRLLVRVSN